MTARNRVAHPHTPDRAVSAAVRAARDTSARLDNVEILDGRRVEDIELAGSSSKLVRHGLKRKGKGAFAVLCTGGPNFLEVGPINAETVRLENHFGSPVTVALWVF